MPTYLLHGFRWPRPLIRIHIILQNLEDAAAEWLVAPGTTKTMLHNFYQLYPDAMQSLGNLRFIEQYDPTDLTPTAASQPYAYVADIVQEVKLGIDVDEVRGRGVGNEQWEAMIELRDKLAPEEKVGWYVVVCGDEERWAPPVTSSSEGSSPNGVLTENGDEYGSQVQESTPKGLMKLFSSGKLRHRKSRKGTDPNTHSPSSPLSLPPRGPDLKPLQLPSTTV